MQLQARESRRFSIVFIVAVFLMSLLMVQVVQVRQADAYALTGCRMPFGTQNYTFGSIGTTQRNAVVAAAGDWSSLTDVNMAQSSGFPTIRATSANFGNTGWDGQAPDYLSCGPGGDAGDRSIRLNTYYSLTAAGWKSVAGHELGHALGLAHVGNASTACASVALMNPGTQRRFVQCSKNTPQADDRNGVNAIY